MITLQMITLQMITLLYIKHNETYFEQNQYFKVNKYDNHSKININY